MSMNMFVKKEDCIKCANRDELLAKAGKLVMNEFENLPNSRLTKVDPDQLIVHT